MTLSIEPTAIESVEPQSSGCPFHHGTPTRKTTPAEPAAKRTVELGEDGVWHVHGYAEAQAVLRGKTKQAGFQSEVVSKMPQYMNRPILFLEGKEHLQQRKQTARFFTPQTTRSNYREMMLSYADEILAEFQADGRADLSDLSMKMAVKVAAQVVGLTNSRMPGMARRIGSFLDGADMTEFSWTPKSLFNTVSNQLRLMRFFYLDVKPAIDSRRAAPQEDVISHLLESDYGPTEIMTECVMYGAAGMVTTREFISIAAWHFLEHPDLRADYLAADEETRYDMLHEMLRLEPVIGNLKRRTVEPISFDVDGETITIPADALIDLHIYPSNADERAVGEEPLTFCPERELASRVQPYALSFGDGKHRCPGASLAIQESDIFLTKLLSFESLRIVKAPQISWNEIAKGYEIREFVIAVD